MDDLSLFFAEEPPQSECNRRTISKQQKALNRRSCYFNENGKPVRPNALAEFDLVHRNYNSLSTGNLNDLMPAFLPPENDDGNIEYKRKLVKPTADRFEHLVTQMKWRLTEGGGEALYRLGVDDNGEVSGLTPSDLASSLKTLQRMALRLNADLEPQRQRVIAKPDTASNKKDHRRAVEVLVRQNLPSNKGNPDLCVAVLGNMDAGKSTLLGVLSQGEKDNGRGKARLNVFRHLHEIHTGRTSSSSTEVLGFDAQNHIINYTVKDDGQLHHICADEIVRESEHLVTLLDLAGHTRYQRTTLAGLLQSQPVHVFIVISANSCEFSLEQTVLNSGQEEKLHGIICTQDHVRLAILLGIPISVVLTKIDLVTAARLDEVCKQLMTQLERTLLSTPKNYRRFISWPPKLFPVSSVTGIGLNELAQFIGSIGSQQQQPLPSVTHSPALPCNSVLYWVTHVFTSVAEVPGPILVGSLRSGSIHDGQFLWIGPDPGGEFHKICVIGLHRNRQPHRSIIAGQRASMAIVFVRDSQQPTPGTVIPGQMHESPLQFPTTVTTEDPFVPRRGMVVLNCPPHPGPINLTKQSQGCAVAWQFAVNRLLLVRYESERDLVNSDPPLVGLSVRVFTGNVCQSAMLVAPPTGGENLMLHVRFCRRPEFLQIGREVVLTYGTTRIVGSLARIEDPVSSYPCECDTCTNSRYQVVDDLSIQPLQPINLDKRTWELLQQVGLDRSDLEDAGASSDDNQTIQPGSAGPSNLNGNGHNVEEVDAMERIRLETIHKKRQRKRNRPKMHLHPASANGEDHPNNSHNHNQQTINVPMKLVPRLEAAAEDTCTTASSTNCSQNASNKMELSSLAFHIARQIAVDEEEPTAGNGNLLEESESMEVETEAALASAVPVDTQMKKRRKRKRRRGKAKPNGSATID